MAAEKMLAPTREGVNGLGTATANGLGAATPPKPNAGCQKLSKKIGQKSRLKRSRARKDNESRSIED